MIVRRAATRPAPVRAAWHTGTVTSAAAETASARRIVLDVPTWPGNDAGQHLDVRLTAPDGYQATRSYSLASSGPGDVGRAGGGRGPGRRGVAVPRPRPAGRRRRGDPRAARGVLRVAASVGLGRPRRYACRPARRRRLRGRAVARDRQVARGGRRHHADAAPLLGAHTVGRVLPGRAGGGRGVRGDLARPRLHPLGTTRVGRARRGGSRIPASRPAWSRRPGTHSCSSAAQPDSWRRWPSPSSTSGTGRASIRTERFGGT